ncbi:hypothetical protein [Streptomyces sp. NPDC059533]|uniref:hypothetical protein n=1 Tax=unclassified Streptomyces TaxID=2593676 RepID=UPI00368E7860
MAIPVMAVLTTMSVLPGAAYAETVDPDGVGGLLPPRGATRGGGTMYETYPHTLTWILDTDYGAWDFLDPAINMAASVLMTILATIGAAVATLADWAFGLTDLPSVQGPLTQAISGSAGAVMVGLFPSALAVGGLVAFLRGQRGDGGGISDLAWVLVSAVAAASLLTAPRMWVDGVDQGRMVGAEVAMSATDAGIGAAGGGVDKIPFTLARPTTYQGDAADRVSRRASDTTWRVYIAVPWCLANFGSIEVCQKHGRAVLDLGTDREARKKYLKQKVTADTVGEESMQWRQGHRPVERVGVLLVAVLVALLFGILLVTLLCGSITALMTSLLLLVVGPIFCALWVIPGRPRQWGVRWLDALVGAVMQSAITTLAAGGVMIIQMVTALAMPTYGYLGCASLSIAGAIAAFKYRALLTGIVGGGAAVGGSGAGALLGALATRSISRQAGRLLRVPGRIGRGLGDAIERRHRPPLPSPRPPRSTIPPRRNFPPPPSAPPPVGGRPPGPGPGPGVGPGRGRGRGGTGPGSTLAAATRRANRTTSTPTGHGQTPVHSPPTRTIPNPAGPGQRQQTPVHSPTAGTILTPPVSSSIPGGPMYQAPRGSSAIVQNGGRRATQPPAPSASRRASQPRPPTVRRPRNAPPPTGWTQPPLPNPPSSQP